MSRQPAFGFPTPLKRHIPPRVLICSCPRCNEEVATGAMWCAHCGYDLTMMGTDERAYSFNASLLAALPTIRNEVVFGLVAAVLFLIGDVFMQVTHVEWVIIGFPQYAAPLMALAVLVVSLFIGFGWITLSSSVRAFPLIVACAAMLEIVTITHSGGPGFPWNSLLISPGRNHTAPANIKQSMVRLDHPYVGAHAGTALEST
jgi:hypothetical protein